MRSAGRQANRNKLLVNAVLSSLGGGRGSSMLSNKAVSSCWGPARPDRFRLAPLPPTNHHPGGGGLQEHLLWRNLAPQESLLGTCTSLELVNLSVQCCFYQGIFSGGIQGEEETYRSA